MHVHMHMHMHMHTRMRRPSGLVLGEVTLYPSGAQPSPTPPT